MTQDEAQAIHARLDEMARGLEKRVNGLETVVRGSGGEQGLQRDVASLKQSRALARAVALAVVGVLGGILGALAQKFWGG